MQMQAPETVKKDPSAKARNFLRMLEDKRSVMWLHLLADMVTCLSDVSVAIQLNRQEKANAGNVTQKIHPPLKQSTLESTALCQMSGWSCKVPNSFCKVIRQAIFNNYDNFHVGNGQLILC